MKKMKKDFEKQQRQMESDFDVKTGKLNEKHKEDLDLMKK